MKKNKWKKILSLFLAFYISMSAFPVLVAGKGGRAGEFICAFCGFD